MRAWNWQITDCKQPIFYLIIQGKILDMTVQRNVSRFCTGSICGWKPLWLTRHSLSLPALSPSYRLVDPPSSAAVTDTSAVGRLPSKRTWVSVCGDGCCSCSYSSCCHHSIPESRSKPDWHREQVVEYRVAGTARRPCHYHRHTVYYKALNMS